MYTYLMRGLMDRLRQRHNTQIAPGGTPATPPPDEISDPAEVTGPDGFVVMPDTPYADAHRLLSRLERKTQTHIVWSGAIRQEAELCAQHADATMQSALVIAAMERNIWSCRELNKSAHQMEEAPTPQSERYNLRHATLYKLLDILLKQPPAFDAEQIQRLLELTIEQYELYNN